MSEHKKDINSLLSSLSDKKLQASTKFSFSTLKKIQAGGGGGGEGEGGGKG